LNFGPIRIGRSDLFEDRIHSKIGSIRSIIGMASESESRGPAVVITSIFFAVFLIIAVSTRLVARAAFLKNAGCDELAIVASLVS
jgi:predicted tellurium resistance membrane protein TerC